MKSIIFDLYGTLIDINTNENSKSFWKKVTLKTVEKDYKILMQRYKDKCNYLSNKYEEIDLKEVFSFIYDSRICSLEEFSIYFRECSIKYLRLYDGVFDLLSILKKEGYKLYVLSNAQKLFTINELKKLNIYHFFDRIALSSEYGIKKPNIMFFKKAITDFDIDINKAIMIGNDYNCDIKPANQIGIRTVFIKSNLTPSTIIKEDLKGFNRELLLRVIHE